MIKFLIDRLKERSTWLGIITILTAAGVHLSPEQSEAIAVAGAAVAGAVAIFTSDPQGPQGPQGPMGIAGPSGFIRLPLLAALLLICLALGSLAGCTPMISNVVQMGCGEDKVSLTNKADSDQAPSTSTSAAVPVSVGASPTSTGSASIPLK